MTDQNAPRSRPIPAGIQFFSIVLFAAFAISTAIVALNAFWPAGIALAGFYAYQWSRIPTLSGGMALNDAVASVRPATPENATTRASGNATFDAYKSELLDRLELEQSNFESFLTRLRAAKDEAEFDSFMDDRAKVARAATGAATGASGNIAETAPNGSTELREPA